MEDYKTFTEYMEKYKDDDLKYFYLHIEECGEKIIEEDDLSVVVKFPNGEIGYRSKSNFQRENYFLQDWAKYHKIKSNELRTIEQLYLHQQLIEPFKHIENARIPCQLIEGHESNSSFTIDDLKQALIKYKDTALKDFVNGKDNAINVIFGELKKKK